MESYTEGCCPRKALFGGIVFPTKVTLGSFLPSVLCVVKLPNNLNRSLPKYKPPTDSLFASLPKILASP